MNRELINTALTSADAWKFYLPGAVLAFIGLYLWFSSIKLSSKDGSLKFVFMTVLVTTIIPLIAVYLLSLTGQYFGYVLLMFPLVALIVSVAFILIGFFYKRLEHSVFASDEVNISSAAKAIIGSTILTGGAYLVYYGLQLGKLSQGESSPFSIVPTAGQFGSLNAMYIILLAAPFAALWTWLDKRKMDPSTPVKFALGIIQVGLGFGALIIGANNPDEAGKVGMIWLVLTYLLHTTGELCLSPVGLSAVTKLSISRVVGVSMGTWFLATALSETIATRLGKIAAIDTDAGEVTDVTAALAKYTELYEFLFYFGLGFGVFMLLISPLLKKGMHGIK
ncbi:MAG: hypothetical protein HWE16_08905 [Gammaproteobacteria bacterium]|nr:hypothetical protein [Gammaproteobacteria bacterium]